jgi:hypothetical protein
MTESEQKRQNDQRRVVDIVSDYETVRVDAQIKFIGIVIASCTFFGSVILYMANATAREVVSPYEARVSKVETRVDNNDKRFDRLEGKMDRILDILDKMRAK